MCGIAGFINTKQIGFKSICSKMVNTLHHRGPDYSSVWVNEDSGVALGHSRLSILDLSSAGHQPMKSSCGRYIITFNGEIYNHLQLRKDVILSGYPYLWTGHSDTETLLSAISIWGIKKALQKSVGMFALALWDIKEKKIILARDRIGEKPIYYGWQGNAFLFGSELKALKVHPEFQNIINRDSLCLLLRHNTISSPYSIYQGISKLSPGSILTLKLGKRDVEVEDYWSMKEIVESALKNPFKGTEQEALTDLESILSKSVSDQMISDVPLGAFLSGGIDSSTIVSLMQSQSSKKIKTFSIGFNEKGYDEARYAKEVANHLNTEHTELYISSSEALDVIPQLPLMFDEPFSDSSQIPTYLVSKLAKKSVDVSLSGDGGDELFGGYNRHFWVKSIWNKTKDLPLFVRRLIIYAITSLSPTTWNQFFQMSSAVFPSKYRVTQAGDKMYKLANVIAAENPNAMYQNLVSHWSNPDSIVLNSREPNTILSNASIMPNLFDVEQRMMFLDTVTYLSDDILTKVDRASMFVSLETRVPMLDHRVVELAWRLPLSMKIKNGQGKWILRQLLQKHVPKKLTDRPKMGFGVPIDSWLRGPLRDWAELLLDPSRLSQEGFFNSKAVREKWDEHISGKRDWQHHLWDVLMFQAWLEKNK
jgi:asparagine synthase (glutamine-hydrolysing)